MVSATLTNLESGMLHHRGKSLLHKHAHKQGYKKRSDRIAINKKIAEIREKQEEQVRLSHALDYSLEIQKIIPDAFEHGSVKEIRWTKVKRTQVSNKYPRMGWVYAGVLTRGDGSTREIPFATLEPRPDNPSFIQLKKKHLMDSGYTIKI